MTLSLTKLDTAGQTHHLGAGQSVPAHRFDVMRDGVCIGSVFDLTSAIVRKGAGRCGNTHRAKLAWGYTPVQTGRTFIDSYFHCHSRADAVAMLAAAVA